MLATEVAARKLAPDDVDIFEDECAFFIDGAKHFVRADARLHERLRIKDVGSRPLLGVFFARDGQIEDRLISFPGILGDESGAVEAACREDELLGAVVLLGWKGSACHLPKSP